jgi:hypothetical protein
MTLTEQRRKHKRGENKSEYSGHRNLINRRAKKAKEEWLGQYCEEIENQLNRGNTEKSCKRIRNVFGKPKTKRIIIESMYSFIVYEEYSR